MDPRLELMAQLVERFNSGDLDRFVLLLDPDVEVHTTLMANPATHRGRDGYLIWAGAWMDAWSDFTVELAGEPELIGDREAVALVHQSGRGLGSGLVVDMDAAFRLTFGDGTITRFHLFDDLETARRAAQTDWSAFDPERPAP